MAKERIQKILNQMGLASRRKAEEWIKLGEITVNGKTAKLGDHADPDEDAIKLRGKLLRAPSAREKSYYLFYKPKGVISVVGADDQGRTTLTPYLKGIKERVFPVEQLDFNEEGLVLLTDDGSIRQKILKHPTLLRTYEAKVKGHPDAKAIARLERGLRIDNKLVRPLRVQMIQEREKRCKIELVFKGPGSSRAKQLLEETRFLVERFIRTRIGHLRVTKLKAGSIQKLKASQVEALLAQPELGERELKLKPGSTRVKPATPKKRPVQKKTATSHK